MNNERDVDVLRRELLGQISIVENRLEILRAELIRKPLGYGYVDEGFEDAQANLSLQTGLLIGLISIYRDKLK